MQQHVSRSAVSGILANAATVSLLQIQIVKSAEGRSRVGALSLMPLVADLAPVRPARAVHATAGLSWWVGLALAPTLGGQLLAVSPALSLIGAAAVAATTIGPLRASEAALPVGVRAIPRPETH